LPAEDSSAISAAAQEAISACQDALEAYPTNARIQYGLGHALLLKGSFKEAVPWLLEAAGAGYEAAQVAVGALYESGRGISQDYAQAMASYKKAADQGNQQAQFSIGQLYASGLGVKQDSAKAIEWQKKAADHGNKTVDQLDKERKAAFQRLQSRAVPPAAAPSDSASTPVASATASIAKAEVIDLSGTWLGTGPWLGDGSTTTEKIQIYQTDNFLVATKITGDDFVPEGDTTFRGVYAVGVSTIQMQGAGRGHVNPRWWDATLTTIDKGHFTIHKESEIFNYERVDDCRTGLKVIDFNGDWIVRSNSDPEVGTPNVRIKQSGDSIEARFIHGNNYIPDNEVHFRGTYTTNPFTAQFQCAQEGYKKATITIKDCNHLSMSTNICSGTLTYERVK
jgi:hypothetical protein